MRTASASYHTAATLYSMGHETAKLFNAIVEVFYCFTVSVGFPGDAPDYNEDKRSAVAVRMHNKVVVERGNIES